MSSTRSLQYRVLHDRLKKEIVKGIYKIGDTLPSENDLCAATNLARSTVRHALSQLEKEGYIVKQRGKGSIVAATRRSLGLLSFQGFSASVNGSSVSTLSVQVPKISPWPNPFFFPLSTEEKHAGCISFSRVRKIEADRVMWETTYLPNLNLPRFARTFNVEHSFFEFLAVHYHVEITGMVQEIRAIHADVRTAKHLKMEKGDALLVINRKYSTSRTSLNIYSALYCNTNKYAMSNSGGTMPS
jgi:GntR family transcriptional regulator/GntR family frlABCD operon transcriptional regulator